MKKLAAILICLCLVLTVFAGCTKTEAPAPAEDTAAAETEAPAAEEPAEETEEPAEETEEPVEETEEPAEETEEPAEETEEPAEEMEEPVEETEEPAAEAEEPAQDGAAETEEPAAETEEPAAETEEPAAETEEPAAEEEEPAETEEPAVEEEEPAVEEEEPAVEEEVPAASEEPAEPSEEPAEEEPAEASEEPEGDASGEPSEAEPTPEPTPEATPEPAGIGHGGTGFDTYPADTVVGTVNGTDVTWMEYFYWLRYYTMYVQQVAGQYGVILDGWDAHDLSADDTNAQVVIMNAQQNIVPYHVIETETAKEGIALTAEDEAEMQDVFDQNADMTTGDGNGEASEEERAAFEQYLQEEMLVDRAFFDQLNAAAILSEHGFENTYGKGGAELSDEVTLAFAEDNGIMGAKHILLLTVDPATREPLTEEEIAEKKATIEELNEQLQAVAGDQEKMIALFDELTAEYTEDTGYARYPDGYVFGEGEMVEAFEEAVKGLDENYGLSEVVESDYGYHIILRIPVEPDAIIGTDANGNDVSLRYAAANRQYSAMMQSWIDGAEVVWNEGFETPDMAAIFG